MPTDPFAPLSGPPRDYGEGSSSFAARYGPWALIAGASDGVGAAIARLLAGHGLNVVLVSIDKGGLKEVAASLPTQSRIIVQDLSKPDAAKALADATADLEIGFFSYVAGADPHLDAFVDLPISEWEWVMERNALTLMRTTYHFAKLMNQRGKGGVVILSSGAGYVGSAKLAMYTATKGFGLLLAESMWAEMRDRGVDVLAVACPRMDTPTYRRLFGTPPPGVAADPADVARHIIDNVDQGPTYPPDPMFGNMSRRRAVELMSGSSTNMPAPEDA